MKIFYCSDLHIDHAKDNAMTFPECDVMVFAGDISNGPKKTLAFFEELIRREGSAKIIYVPGNHDFYRSNLKAVNDSFKELQTEHPDKFIYLNRDFVVIDDVLFVGCTLWSNLRMENPGIHIISKMGIEWWINDFRMINSWNVNMMLDENLADYDFLIKCSKMQAKKKVAITHFAPHIQSIDPKYKDEPDHVNCYWVNNYPDHEVTLYDFWIHGHTHSSMDYVVRNPFYEKDCRVVCNPRGYENFVGPENPAFSYGKVLTI